MREGAAKHTLLYLSIANLVSKEGVGYHMPMELTIS